MLPSACGPIRTVRFKTAVVPKGVATDTAHGPSGPSGLMENLAVIWVGLTRAALETAIAGQVCTTEGD